MITIQSLSNIWISSLPLPPSINKQLTASRGRLIKTSIAHKFDSDVNRFILKNNQDVIKLRQMLKDVSNKEGFSVDCFFAFSESRLISKTKKAKDWVKTIDANNRLKSTLDAVSKIIDVDDKFFFTGLCEKIICKSLDEEQVLVRIRPVSLRTLEQIKEMKNHIS